MSLDVAGLQAALAALEPPSRVQAAADWADACEAWASGIVPASSTVTTAANLLEGSIYGAFSQTNRITTASNLESAFAAFATEIGLGMAGYTPTPPAGLVGFSSLLGTIQPTRAAWAAAWASALDTWMQTGTATLIAPPNTVVPWS